MVGNRLQMAEAILRGLGAPLSRANVQALLAWGQAEGGNAAYNLFNTTQGAPGATNYNSVGVKNYPTFQAGLLATLQTLRNGDYGGILAALHAGTNPYAVAQAVGSSPWGTSGSLMAEILHGQGAPGYVPGTPASGAGGMPSNGYLPPAGPSSANTAAALALLLSRQPLLAGFQPHPVTPPSLGLGQLAAQSSAQQAATGTPSPLLTNPVLPAAAPPTPGTLAPANLSTLDQIHAALMPKVAIPR